MLKGKLDDIKVAVVHEWLTDIAGSEKTLLEILKVVPQADLYCTVYNLNGNQQELFKSHKVKTSFLQKLPLAKRFHRIFLPLMPLAIEQHDLKGYDLVITSSHAVAKGVITGPDQLHICYCFTPMRYAWDLQNVYLKNSKFGKMLLAPLTRIFLHYLRIWDLRTVNGVDQFIAISKYIERRISKTYRRNSIILPCPVDTQRFHPLTSSKDGSYVTASRFVPYKRIDLIVETFTKSHPDKTLHVVGAGPEFKRIKALAGPNVFLHGYKNDEFLMDKMQKAKAFVFAAEEDFGIVPVEAQACGTPVIAFGRGGALDTVNDLSSNKPTGVFFYEQTAESLAEAINFFEKNADKFLEENCVTNASTFDAIHFRNQLQAIIKTTLSSARKRR